MTRRTGMRMKRIGGSMRRRGRTLASRQTSQDLGLTALAEERGYRLGYEKELQDRRSTNRGVSPGTTRIQRDGHRRTTRRQHD
eukprot:4018398-Pyramimonas_sp.AAC.1